MHTIEKHATFSLAILFSLRMLGLFMILPVFTPYAETLPGTTPLLIGLALGIYGLTQAIFQLPFGALSDYFPRKNIIILGFLIFTLGSLIAANSQHIWGIIIGRALQGTGAVGSTIIALLSDLTRPEKRSKSMAVLGIIIGFTFFVSLFLGPVLSEFITVSGIFWLSAGLGILAILLTFIWVPSPPNHNIIIPKPNHYFIQNIKLLIKHPKLLELDLGIFLLHAILTASFVVIPLYIKSPYIYIPSLILSAVFTFKFLHSIRSAVVGLILAELLLYFFHANLYFLIFELFIFFTSFNILEANLPSLVSRTAPVELKGTAIGLYSTCQFLGMFVGGVLGGFFYGHFSAPSVLLLCASLGVIWIAKSRHLVKNGN